MEVFLRYWFGGLIFGGAYIWRGLFSEFLRYFKNIHKNPKFGKVRQVSTREFPTKFPHDRLGLVSLFQIWDFCGYSLNTLKYPKMGIFYFFRCEDGYIAKSLQIQCCFALVV